MKKSRADRNKTKHKTKGTNGKMTTITWEDVLEKAKSTIRAINASRKAMAPPKPDIPEKEIPQPALPKATKEVPNSVDEEIFKPLADSIKGISDEERNQAIVVLKKLAFLDSIHDFWPKRGSGSSGDKKSLSDPDESAPLDIDPARINKVHENLLKSIETYVTKQSILPAKGGAKEKPEKTPEQLKLEEEDRILAAKAGDILKKVTGSAVGSVHGIEEKFIEYLKRNFSPFNEPEYVIKVSEVLTKWRFAEDYKRNWAEYSNAIKTKLPTTVMISIDGMYIKSLDEKQLGTLGFFILACMDPNKQPGTGDEYFTFDMGPRDIGKIFAKFDQVKNAIYPQNVADSAVTSFTALEGRSVFFRANDTISSSTNLSKVEQPILANTFTHGKYELKFVDTGFSNKNRFGFYIEVLDAKTKESKGSIKFGKGSEQGPSVNYLMDIISKGSLTGVSAPAPKVARLDGIKFGKGVDNDLLFDLKRIGDQEQMRVTGARGITGDHFASVFRRTLRMPGIFHSTKGFRVWRAPLVGETPEQARKKAIEFRKTKVVEKLKLVAGLCGIGNRVQTVRDDLLRMYDQFSDGADKGFVFTNPIPIQGQLTQSYIGENYTAIASTFATYLLRMRMRDMLEHVSLLIMRVEALDMNLESIDAAACNIQQPKQSDPSEACPPPTPLTDEQVEDALYTLETYVEQLDVLRGLNVSFYLEKDASGRIIEKTPEIYTQLIDPDGRLIKGATSTLFNFSADHFLHPETGFTTVVARLLDISNMSERAAARLGTKINELLVSYFQSRDAIKEAFYDPVYKDEAEELTDIQIRLTPSQVLNARNEGGLIGAINRMADRFGNMSGGSIEETEQEGGAGEARWSPLQYRDLHDLFFQLCLQARVAIQNQDNARETLDTIEATWITEVDQIRSRAKEDYEEPYENVAATEYISYLLSFRTGGDKESLFDTTVVSRREEKEFIEVKTTLSGKEDVDGFVLLVLAGFANIIQTSSVVNDDEDTKVKIRTMKYASRAGWTEELVKAIRSLLVNPGLAGEVLPLLRGGNLDDEDDTPPNADAPSGSSRRKLYAGLRKRSGSGSSAEL